MACLGVFKYVQLLSRFEDESARASIPFGVIISVFIGTRHRRRKKDRAQRCRLLRVECLERRDLLAVATFSSYVDFLQDGVLDAADYMIWRKGLGTTYTQDDVKLWRANFGNLTGNGAAANANVGVPEPTASLVLVVGLLTLTPHPRPAVLESCQALRRGRLVDLRSCWPSGTRFRCWASTPCRKRWQSSPVVTSTIFATRLPGQGYTIV
jgi:hypothetical protein